MLNLFFKKDMTIITGFIETNSRGNFKDYLNYAEQFTLQIPNNMIIFVEKHNIQSILNVRKKYSFEKLTHIIPIELNELKLYKYLNDIKMLYELKKEKVNVKSYLPEYLLVVNSKFEFFEKSLLLNPFKTYNFMWIDFGISKRGYNNIDMLKIKNIIKSPKPNVSYAIITSNFNCDDCKDGFIWVAAGGLITLNNTLNSIEFLKIWENVFIKCLNENIYILEEYILFYIYKYNLVNLDIFYANYDTLVLKYHGDHLNINAKKKREIVLKNNEPS